MRLIDADKIHHSTNAKEGKQLFKADLEELCCQLNDYIDNQPTVKAIPIEWLYQKRTLYLENECYMSLMVINEILNWWEKENEID